MYRVFSGFVLLLSVIIYPLNGSSESIQKQFIIGGYVGPHQTEEQFLFFKQAGFNTVLDYPGEGVDHKETLRLAEKTGGLSVLLNLDERFLRYKLEPSVPYERMTKFINENKTNKQVIGYFIFDEPVFDKPNDNVAALLDETQKFMRQIDPDRLTWINFYPLTHEALARSIVAKSKPTIMSTCYYPYNVKSDNLRVEKMYPVLEFYRSLALENGIPFWLFVQSVEQIWPLDRNSDMRMPTASEMRMQVYVNLAYGAKGLWYYTYAIPRNFKDISAAVLDSKDKPTTAYDIVKQLNKEVQVLGPVLMTLNSVDVMHLKPSHNGVKPFVANSIIAKIDGENLLTGFFKDASGGDYFMVVNKLTKSANRNIRLSLQPRVKGLMQIDKISGRPVNYPLASGAAVVSLEPGDGMLFKVI